MADRPIDVERLWERLHEARQDRAALRREAPTRERDRDIAARDREIANLQTLIERQDPDLGQDLGLEQGY